MTYFYPMIKELLYLTLGLLLFQTTLNSQTIDRKGQGYFYWGYNRAFYSASDINFSGPGYDFTLHGALAADRPTPYESNIYLNPSKLTIPQFNFRLGYFINSKTSLSVGWDHMKYVVQDFQRVPISGFIEESASTLYNGIYDGSYMSIDAVNFLHFEHTDGLNYVRFNIDHHHELKSFWKDRLQVSVVLGAGTGLMMPQSDVRLFGHRVNNNTKVYIQGFALSSNYGVKLDFFKHFYFQLIANNGYINMPKIRTRGDDSDRAQQEIWYMQYLGVFGAYINLNKKD